MVEIDSQSKAPSGFVSRQFRGLQLKLSLIEPESEPTSAEDWSSLISSLEPWGETPSEIEALTCITTERGPVLTLETSSGRWTAEILPWGSARMSPRSRIAPPEFCTPNGGYTDEGTDLILVRRINESATDAHSVLVDHLSRSDESAARALLERCGAALGRFHEAAAEEWTNPPDQKRWNERFHEIEGRLKARSLWRAPFTRGAPATLSIGDLRFSMFGQDQTSRMGIRLGPPRLADGLIPPDTNMPAIRDLASLLHDLSRVHHQSTTDIELSNLRAALMAGWASTAPNQWSSKQSFSAHTGGVVIWEYEQALLDVVEAVSNQSGSPEPAVSIITAVPVLQQGLFNARILSAGWMICAIFGGIGVYNWIEIMLDERMIIPTFPIVLFSAAFLLRRRYLAAAPAPEMPIH